MSTYTIQRGDTLSGIASKYGTTWQELYNANKGVIGSNPNLIYSGTVLTLPGTEQQATQSTPVASTPTTPTKTTQQLATEYANAQTANNANETAQLLAQYEKIAEQQRNALQQSKDLAAQQINAQKEDVLSAYNDNARQAYINKMLGQKSVEQQLSQARLNTSGLLGSAYANVENSYGNNLATLQKSRDYSINDINKQLNESNMQYAIQESKLLSDIENARLELQKYGNELAYKKYQDAISNYMNFANYDYTKAKDERDYNYQKERDAVKDSQWAQEFALAQKKTSSGSSGRSRSSSSGSDERYIIPDDTTSNAALAGAALALATLSNNGSGGTVKLSNGRTGYTSAVDAYKARGGTTPYSATGILNNGLVESVKYNGKTYYY